MASKPLNSTDGFSVGPNAANVILANADVTANNLSVSGVANLGPVGNVIITGGTLNYILSTDGTGNLAWVDPTGYSGFSGYSGISGFSGRSGFSGFSGTSGFSGVSGFSGFSGISGFSGSGVSGFSGRSGYSGLSGFSGVATATISDTPPLSPVAGDLWWDDVSGTLKIYYTDTDGSQWVAASPATVGASGFSGFSGASSAGGPGSFGITINGGGSAITTGVKGYVTVPYNCTITGWTLLADISGSIVIDLWKDTYANYPPTVADTITGTEKPTLSSSIKNQDLALTTWTTSVTAGDIIAFNVDSATTVTSVNLTINTTKV